MNDDELDDALSASSAVSASDAAAPEAPSQQRIVIGLEYDGAQFRGWQRQPDGATVQAALEHALQAFTLEPISSTVAGRTDTGVHALNQIVHFDTSVRRADFSWVRGVNAFLPPGVNVQWATPISRDFNARFSAFERTYDYVLYVHAVRPTMMRGRVGWIHTPLLLAPMQEAAALLVGRHDFSAFRSSECQAKSPVKTMREVSVVRHGDFIHFRFRASAFLHHMVRNLVGCLVMIGRGRQPASWVTTLLAQRDRRLAAPTFMPDGLYLTRVSYPPEFVLPAPNIAARPGTLRWPDEPGASGLASVAGG